MKRIIIAAFITVILSVSLFANENYSYYEPYTYFIYNENSLTQEQLSQINHLKNEYQTKIEKLRKKMYLERTKINLEMAKQNPDSIIINNSIKLNKNETSFFFNRIGCWHILHCQRSASVDNIERH